MPIFNLKTNYILLWFVVCLVCILPLATLILRLIPHPELLATLYEPSVVRSLFVSLTVALTSLILALGFGIPLSYLISRANIRGRGFFGFWLLFPIFIPSYLFAISWVALALPKTGLLNRLFGINWINIYSFWGLVWVTCNAYFPFVVNTLSKSFSNMDSSLEEAARVCGASPFRVFVSITLPCQLSNIVGAALVFLFVSLSSFGIPAIIGNPAKLYVLTTQIFTYSKMGGLNGTDQAFVVSLWLVLFSLLLTVAGRKFKDKYAVALTTGKATRPSLLHLGKWQIPSELFLCFLLLTFVLLPLGALFVSSFLSVAGDLSLTNFSLQNYAYIFQLKEAKTALFNSLSLSFLGGITCCSLGFAIVFFSHRSSLRGRVWIEKLSTVPFSIPGTVLALAFLVSFGTGWGISELSLLGTPFLIFVAYTAKDLAIAVQTLGPALNQIDRSLEEAGRVFGANTFKVIDHILFPILLPTLRSVFFLCALPMLSELTMSILLYGPGTETLGTLIFQLQDYASPLAACALASLLIGLLGSGMLIGQLFSRIKT